MTRGGGDDTRGRGWYDILSPLWGFGFLGAVYRRFTPVAIILASLRDLLLSHRSRSGLSIYRSFGENRVGKQVTHPTRLIKENRVGKQVTHPTRLDSCLRRNDTRGQE